MNVFKCIVVVLGIILNGGIKGTASDTHCGNIVVQKSKGILSNELVDLLYYVTTLSKLISSLKFILIH